MQNQVSLDLYFNIKDYEISLYTFVKFVEDQMASLLDCLDDYGEGMVTVMKAFIECLFGVRPCDAYFTGRISLMTDDNPSE